MLSWLAERSERLLGFSNEPVSRSGKAYIIGVIILGTSIIIHSAVTCLSQPDATWILLAAVSALLAVLSTSMGRSHEKIGMTLCDVTVFLALFLCGPAAGVMAAVSEGLAFNLRRHVHRVYRQLFNLGQIAIVAAFAGHIFYLTYGGEAPLDREAVGNPVYLLIAAAASGLYYCLMTSGLVARAISFSCRQRFDEVWVRCIDQAHVTSAGALLGAAIFLILY